MECKVRRKSEVKADYTGGRLNIVVRCHMVIALTVR